MIVSQLGVQQCFFLGFLFLEKNIHHWGLDQFFYMKNLIFVFSGIFFRGTSKIKEVSSHPPSI